ncbi:methyltransferase domain-containing protein [Rhizoctonia solani AG-1 IA]|uniref:Methyltransferase domain-containing protein n=1 Tax=Thanatephorus cucumeris (strain AG1-IA) TaxID=983506 RepID=L8WN18_THACA|nr:methyltransferase domain-containing protein [Rhizoctonia solani AG-1 IA]
MPLPDNSQEEAAPVYLVTDNDHDNYDDEFAEVRSEAMTSESSSARTMSTLSTGEVATLLPAMMPVFHKLTIPFVDYFKTLHGFTYVTDDNIPLAFPTDAVAERINVVFNIITRLSQGGKNVPAIAEELLIAGGLDGTGARVLSLVTNSGVCRAYEVASTYPSTEIVSIDVKPLTALVPHERIKFEVYDIYAGIAEPDANYNFMLREMHRVLKPGGLLVIGEMPSQSYEASNPSIPLRTSPMRTEAIRLMRKAHTAQGIDLAAWDDMAYRLDPGHPMWENQNLDIKTTVSSVRGFRTITTSTYLIPNGPWSNEETQRVIGSMGKLIFEKAWKALPPMLRMMGMNESDAAEFLSRLEAEVQNPNYRSYAKYKIWCARRI